MKFSHILISRTDSIGDVILTLPLAGLLKLIYPEARISFLGMPYTKDVIESCGYVDRYLDWNFLKSLPEKESVKQIKELNADLIIHVFPRREIAELVKKAGIPFRIGSTGRIYHWWSCNQLVRLSRKHSNLHEALLNLKLVEPIADKTLIGKIVSEETIRLDELHNNHAGNNMTGLYSETRGIPSLYGFSVQPPADKTFGGIINPSYLNIILHPRSKGSAREWGVENYSKLARNLAHKNVTTVNGEKACKVFITGTKTEGDMLAEEGFFEMAGPDVINVTGRFNLTEFMQFINTADAIVAGSTGPLHIASALGIIALGLYPPIRPMHPGRWAPLGIKADYLVAGKECSKCRKQSKCDCMKLITTDDVQQKLEAMVLKYYSQTTLA